MHLMGANALLARIEQMRCQPPLGERDFAAFEYGPDRDGELAFAFVAVVEAGAMALASYQRDPIAVGAAMRADRAIGPAHGLKGLAGRVQVVEDRVLCVASGHG